MNELPKVRGVAIGVNIGDRRDVKLVVPVTLKERKADIRIGGLRDVEAILINVIDPFDVFRRVPVILKDIVRPIGKVISGHRLFHVLMTLAVDIIRIAGGGAVVHVDEAFAGILHPGSEA